MLCIVAVQYTHINTCYVLLLYTTHINTCYVLLLYTTHISTHAIYTLLYTTHIPTHAMYCCCILHTYQHMLCIAAVHYTHINTCYVYIAVHYTHTNTCYVLLLYTTHISTHAMYCCCTLHTYQHMLCNAAVHYTHINTCYVLLLLLTVPCFPQHNNLYILYLVAIVDCTHVG